MVWSNNELWMLTGDHSGFIKYWQSNMNNVKMYQGHREAVRGVRYVYDEGEGYFEKNEKMKILAIVKTTLTI